MTQDCDFIGLAVPGVRSMDTYEPGKSEEELKREFGLSDVIKLASNENPLGASPKAIEAVEKALPSLNRYPDGNGFELKVVLAARHEVELNQITLGDGSGEVLALLAQAFVNPGDEVVFSEYAFALYPLITQAASGVARVAAANSADDASPRGHNLDNIANQISHKTRLVFIANPNNPTGTWLQPEDLLRFIRSVPPQVLVVIDEAYKEYVDAEVAAPTIGWMSGCPNLVVTRTFSKAYGLAGLRIGYAVSNSQVADVLNRIRQPFNTSLLAQVAALAALEDIEFLETTRKLNRAGMVQLLNGLEDLGLACLPSRANFLCIELGEPGKVVFEALLREGVIVRALDCYDLPNCIRVTIGTEAQNNRFLKALAKVKG